MYANSGSAKSRSLRHVQLHSLGRYSPRPVPVSYLEVRIRWAVHAASYSVPGLTARDNLSRTRWLHDDVDSELGPRPLSGRRATTPATDLIAGLQYRIASQPLRKIAIRSATFSCCSTYNCPWKLCRTSPLGLSSLSHPRSLKRPARPAKL